MGQTAGTKTGEIGEYWESWFIEAEIYEWKPLQEPMPGSENLNSN